MPDIDSILAERGRTHGAYRDHAAVTQAIKDIYRGHQGWARLTACQRETLDMHAHKVGRILAGDPSHQDHWDDIAGYARLVSQEIARTVDALPEPVRHSAHSDAVASLLQRAGHHAR